MRATAQALHLTHSAVSQQIKTLEEQLGIELFARVKRSVVLTPAGEVLLRGVEIALDDLDLAVEAARAATRNSEQMIRLSVLPSFAQRWLLPRMGKWREAYPEITLNIEASAQTVDLRRPGFHAGIRIGSGRWPGVEAEPLFRRRTRLIVVASPETGRRLVGATAELLLKEPLLGAAQEWEEWFAAAGVPGARVRPVADFNDYGLMLQAAEQGLGLALTREILASDALAEGKLAQLSDVALTAPDLAGYYLAYAPALKDWAPLVTLRSWLRSQMDT